MTHKFFTRQHLFAIQKKVIGKTEKLIPVVKEPGFMSQWRPIVRLYNTYQVMDFEHPEGLTRLECEDHIKGYKRQIDDAKIEATRSQEIEMV